MRKNLWILIPLLLTGCIGWNPAEVLDGKPFSYVRGGDQFGRDQLANRWLVAEKKISIKGRESNDVITLLGQPQEIRTRQHKISEDWFFVYYKAYKTRPRTEQGSFVVRMYHDQVMDVVPQAHLSEG